MYYSKEQTTQKIESHAYMYYKNTETCISHNSYNENYILKCFTKTSPTFLFGS